MHTTHSFITSDIHLGSNHCRPERFIAFLDALPPEAELVLAGDVVDYWHQPLQGIHAEALIRLVEFSHRQRIVWIRGNHDSEYVCPNPGLIHFEDNYSLGNGIFVAHGHHFDNITPYHKWFIHLVLAAHSVRVRLGAESIHVARFAKRFKRLYGVFCNHVAMNATEYACENGYTSVVCGHTHHNEMRTINGIRYFNTGAWTEATPHYVEVTENDITLRSVVRAPETHDETHKPRIHN